MTPVEFSRFSIAEVLLESLLTLLVGGFGVPVCSLPELGIMLGSTEVEVMISEKEGCSELFEFELSTTVDVGTEVVKDVVCVRMDSFEPESVDLVG